MRKIMIAILVSLFAMGAYATNPATATATKQANYQQTTSQNNWLAANKRSKSTGKAGKARKAAGKAARTAARTATRTSTKNKAKRTRKAKTKTKAKTRSRGKRARQ